jgi:hypothetical protein
MFTVVRGEDGGHAGRVPRILRWGLIPSWSKDKKLKFPTHDARAETVDPAASSAPGGPGAAASSSPTASTSGARATLSR